MAPYTKTLKDAYINERLDFSNTPFTSEADDYYYIRYTSKANNLDSFEIPYSKDFDPVNGKENWSQPFLGNGYTGSPDVLIPEYNSKSLFPKEAIMYKNNKPYAYFDKITRKFVEIT